MINFDKIEISQTDFNIFFNKYLQKKKIESYQLNKFHNYLIKHNNFNEIINKLIDKYSSDNYVNKWLNRNIEPPNSLFYFIYLYGIKYGRNCTQDEYQNYGNMFTHDLIYVNGYFINFMIGQGNHIQIIKNEK